MKTTNDPVKTANKPAYKQNNECQLQEQYYLHRQKWRLCLGVSLFDDAVKDSGYTAPSDNAVTPAGDSANKTVQMGRTSLKNLDVQKSGLVYAERFYEAPRKVGEALFVILQLSLSATSNGFISRTIRLLKMFIDERFSQGLLDDLI